MPPIDQIQEALAAAKQTHVLAFVDELDEAARAGLLEQIGAIDLELLGRLYGGEAAAPLDTNRLAPAPCYDLDGDWDRTGMRHAGEARLAGGTVAAFTVAGGQGTRLGWNGPKGTYPATPVTGKPLFRVFAEQIAAAQARYGVTIPWYIMTSPLNDAATRAFLEDNNCFGLERQNIFMFPQGTIPSLDADSGQLLLSDKGAVAVNPDGHGGSIAALRASGALDDMTARGIETISYFQVDNPTVHVFDPVFIGLHASAPDSSNEMSSKMVRKTDAAEKVGVFCRDDERTVVIEYSDLPDELAQATDADGQLRFAAGSIAVHLLGVDFVRRLTDSGTALPWHRAHKKVPHIDPATGEHIEPDAPNAIKFETFVFDALRFAESSIVLETDRVEEFAPIKNGSGNDSPATSHALQSERAARWLELAGVNVPRTTDGSVDAVIEIGPLTSLDADGLRSMSDLPGAIDAGSTTAL